MSPFTRKEISHQVPSQVHLRLDVKPLDGVCPVSKLQPSHCEMLVFARGCDDRTCRASAGLAPWTMTA